MENNNMKEEIKKIGEQPNTNDAYAVATGIDNEVSHCDGSPMGKFKNADKLLDAYNELQSEFTRKCQRLSEAEKKLQEVESGESSRVTPPDAPQIDFAWNKNIKEFLQSHKFAGSFAEEITNELIKDETLRLAEDGLEKAYFRVLDKNFVSKEDLANDQNFLENHIYNNEEIKQKIIKEYVSSLQKMQSPITLMTGGYDKGASGNKNITSLEDAKKYVENMFKF